VAVVEDIGRDVGGRNDKLREAALRRLAGTTVETSM